MKNFLKKILGRVLVVMQPRSAADLAKRGMTLDDQTTFTLKERLMRNYMLQKAEEKGNFDALAAFHRDYWKQQGKGFFARTHDNFQNIFLPECTFIFDMLQKELATGDHRFDTLVEIGTGNGDVLNYLSSKFGDIDRFVGIDLSQEQVEINQYNYSENSRIEFVAADGFEWVKAHGRGNTIFVTSLGVLEYFTEQRLQDFLQMLSSLGKIQFVAIEPNGEGHDFEQNAASEPYGHERSFSHNYPKLFKNAGFTLWHHSTKEYDNRDHYFSFIGAGN